MVKNNDEYLDKFEDSVKTSIQNYLTNKGQVDRMLPDAPDIEGKWEQVCVAYLHDGVREFAQYPTVSLGWMMFIGMAIAHMWDEDWSKYSDEPDLYNMLRAARGYDNLDDYICDDVLHLDAADAKEVSTIVGDAASIAYQALMREGFEPGTPAAFNAYVRCLHTLYYFGSAMQLKRMGYHMAEMKLSDLFDPLSLN